MAKPAVVSWATDATYATGPEVGDPPRLEPSSGFKAQGFIATEEAAARHMNWALGQLGDWTAYVNGLPTDADFVDEDFTWGGAHTFDGDVTFNDDVFLPTVVNVTTLNVAGNATFELGMFLDGTTNELRYSNASVVTPRARIERVKLHGGKGAGVATTRASGFVLDFTGTTGETWSLDLPRGASLTEIVAAGYNFTGGTASYRLELYRQPRDFTAGGIADAAVLIDTADATSVVSAGDFTVTLTMAETIDNSLYEYVLTFGVIAGAGGSLGGLRATYLDPGPRNG